MFALFRIAWWPAAGKELSVRVLLYLSHITRKPAVFVLTSTRLHHRLFPVDKCEDGGRHFLNGRTTMIKCIKYFGDGAIKGAVRQKCMHSSLQNEIICDSTLVSVHHVYVGPRDSKANKF